MSKLEDTLTDMDRDELIKLCMSYDEYVSQIINENEGEPVCLAEYIDNDWQEIKELLS